MKESYVDIKNIRLKVFSEIAKLAYENQPLETLPDIVFNVLPGEIANYRDSIFRERAIVGERLRLTLGLNNRGADHAGKLTEGIQDINVRHNIYSAPLVSVITFACEACPTKSFEVTGHCRKCLAHPCTNVCPVNAVSMRKKSAFIDTEKCIKCGRCKEACPYSAIIKFDRPCASVCGVDAIGSDYLNRAIIDQDKCVACGRCITECPFGSIADKSQIYQLIQSIRSGEKVSAAIAPSFVGQFGPLVSPEQIFEAIRALGIRDVVEVGLGADFTTISEAVEFLEKVPEEQPFMGTSCCYSWAKMVENTFPEIKELISDTSTPMNYTARYLKDKDPDTKVVFIGPCISKKLEALNDNVRGNIDFVITFEELLGMFVAKGIQPADIENAPPIHDASKTGRGYPSSGGVAKAVQSAIHDMDASKDVPIVSASDLRECIKMVRIAKSGKYDGYLLEGMACPDGCIGGAGCIVSSTRVRKHLSQFVQNSGIDSPLDNENLMT